MINHKDLYLTTFTGGTSGTFLTVLIYSWLEDLDFNIKNIKITKECE